MKTAAVVVDYQKGFGDKKVNELYVQGGEEVVGNINSRMSAIKSEGGIVIASRELHRVGNIGFASSYVGKLPIIAVPSGDARGFVTLDEARRVGPSILSAQAGFSYEELLAYLETMGGFIPMWPDHCVDGTPGAQYVDGFDASKVDYEVIKGNEYAQHPFSAANAVNPTTGMTTLQILEKHKIEVVEILGLATDYCDKDTALDIVATGRCKVKLILSCVRAVAPETEKAAIELMKNQSVLIA